MAESETPKWRFVPPEVEVPAEDPFRQDRLDRKPEVERLALLVSQVETPFVLALDAPWGTGKSTLVRMWQKLLRQRGFKTIYFNAWTNDTLSDPLLGLIGEVGRIMPRSKTEVTRERLKTAAGVVLRKATPIGVRILTAGLVDVKTADFTALESAISEAAEKVVEETIEQYQRHRSESESFQQALHDVVEKVAGGRPLIFFVDELDRCRPSFAVQLLERIKHLFEIPGVIFVLSMHRQQLVHSVKAVYGAGFDAEGYLGRFFHLRYRLSEPANGKYAEFLRAEVYDGRWGGFGEAIGRLMVYLRFSPRQEQRCLAHASLLLRVMGREQRDNRDVYAALVVLRELSPSLYDDFLAGRRSTDDLLDHLESVDPVRWRSTQEYEYIEAGLLALGYWRRAEGVFVGDEVAWQSTRLQRYSEIAKDETGEPDHKRIERILAALKAELGDPGLKFQYRGGRGVWGRVCAVMELSTNFGES